MTPEHAAALDALARALDTLADTGRWPPCRGRWSEFLSEDADTRSAAADACHACPVLEACDEAGAHETAGAWAGRDRQTAARPKGPRRQEATP